MLCPTVCGVSGLIRPFPWSGSSHNHTAGAKTEQEPRHSTARIEGSQKPIASKDLIPRTFKIDHGIEEHEIFPRTSQEKEEKKKKLAKNK